MKLGRRKRNRLLAMIRKHDDPILHASCTLADDDGRAQRIETMKAILAATDNGVGIAAPQCGYNDRIIIVHDHYKPWPHLPYAMIDPKFTVEQSLYKNFINASGLYIDMLDKPTHKTMFKFLKLEVTQHTQHTSFFFIF